LLQLLLEHGNFLNMDISRGSVATYFRCGGIFKYEYVANLPLSASDISEGKVATCLRYDDILLSLTLIGSHLAKLRTGV